MHLTALCASTANLSSVELSPRKAENTPRPQTPRRVEPKPQEGAFGFVLNIESRMTGRTGGKDTLKRGCGDGGYTHRTVRELFDQAPDFSIALALL